MSRLTTFLLVLLALSLPSAAGAAAVAGAAAASGPPNPSAALPALGQDVPANGSMECPSRVTQPAISGAAPGGWTAVVISAMAPPDIENGRYYFSNVDSPEQRSCDPGTWVEHLEGNDDWVFMSADWKTPPTPGKPFDAALYQQIQVTPGTAYSLSAWMISLCGGADPRGYCPSDYYIAKMIGIDPTGGTDPLAGSVQWIENRTPHQINGVPQGWQNLRMGATAETVTMTVFARVNSPFQWAANQAFLDAVKLVQAPTASFSGLPAEVHGIQIPVSWSGDLGPDIPSIPKGNYQLRFDVEYQVVGSPRGWQPWLTDQAVGSAVFTLIIGGLNPTVQFRVRPRAEQPPCPPGQSCDWARPNHRFPGVWAVSQPIQVTIDPPGLPVHFLPIMQQG